MEMAFPGIEFLPIILQILSCIFMAKIQKTEEQTFRTEAQSHIIEREFNHNMLLTTKGQRDRLSHLFFPFLLYLAFWTTEHASQNTLFHLCRLQNMLQTTVTEDDEWKIPQIWANLLLILNLAAFEPWF